MTNKLDKQISKVKKELEHIDMLLVGVKSIELSMKNISKAATAMIELRMDRGFDMINSVNYAMGATDRIKDHLKKQLTALEKQKKLLNIEKDKSNE